MPIKKRFMTGLRNQMPRNVLMRRKVAKVQKIESNILVDCNLKFKDGMQRAGKMQGQEKVDFLRKLQRALIDSGVNRTYNPKVEEQSYVHKRVEGMAFNVAKEIVITEEKMKKR